MKQARLVLLVLLLPSAMLLFFDWNKPDLSDGDPSGTTIDATRLEPPVTVGTGQPDLIAVDSGGVALSWQKSEGPDKTSLWVTTLAEDTWSPARMVSEGPDRFVNWADFPALAGRGQLMAVSWLQRTADLPYAYDVRVALSPDGGERWTSPVTPHSDGTPTEHGFVSMQPWGDGFAIAWLDGRHTGPPEQGTKGAMTLRAAFISPDGRIDGESLLDDRVCDCCQTAMVVNQDKLHLFYRDRSQDEVRDISSVSFDSDSGWSAPSSVATDGWRIHGCPVNGPAAASQDGIVAVAWFTEAEEARIQMAVFGETSDGLSPLAAPFRVDDGDPVGRTDILFLSDGSALVSWLAFLGDGENAILVRRVAPGGRKSLPQVATLTPSGRTTGFPRMASYGRDVLLAWTDPDKNRVEVVRLQDPAQTLPLR